MKHFLIATLCLVAVFTSCVNNNDVVLKSSPHIKSFHFKTHTAVPGIENITFTVDTINSLIYNEDSVAYGYSLTKLLPSITYTGTPKEVKINNVSWNAQDSLDFSQPVSMYILSQNKKNEATYNIRVNQHSVNPDEIIWKEPTTLNNNVSTFKIANTSQAIYVFTNTATDNQFLYNVYCNQGNGWTQLTSFKSEYNIVSTATYQDRIYAIDPTGTTLLQFNQDQWQAVATCTEGNMTVLLGNRNQALWIAGTYNNASCLFTYNGQQIQQNTQSALPNLFALEGATPLQTPYGLYLIGGKKEGIAQNCILSSDNGYYWTNILNQTGKYCITPCYEPICAYYDHSIFVIGGYSNNQVITDNYVSNNNGYSWDKIVSHQQLPTTFTFQKGACATVFNNNLYVFNTQSNQSTLEVWEGRIRRVDFIKK